MQFCQRGLDSHTSRIFDATRKRHCWSPCSIIARPPARQTHLYTNRGIKGKDVYGRSPDISDSRDLAVRELFEMFIPIVLSRIKKRGQFL